MKKTFGWVQGVAAGLCLLAAPAGAHLDWMELEVWRAESHKAVLAAEKVAGRFQGVRKAVFDLRGGEGHARFEFKEDSNLGAEKIRRALSLCGLKTGPARVQASGLLERRLRGIYLISPQGESYLLEPYPGYKTAWAGLKACLLEAPLKIEGTLPARDSSTLLVRRVTSLPAAP